MYKTLIILILLDVFTFLLAQETEQPMHTISFSGQKHFDKVALEDALGVENKSTMQFWKDDNPRIKDTLRPTLEQSLKSFYQSEGFYDATFSIKDTNTTIDVAITENKPIRIRDINISSDFNISSLVTLHKNDIFKAKTFIGIKSKIVGELLKEGYCSYDLDTKAYVDLDTHNVDVRYSLSKGGVCTFGKLSTSGLKTIDEEIIRSRVKAKEGERFNIQLVQETSNALYGLDAFDTVLIDVDKKIYNVIPVDIRFNELAKPYQTEIGIGYDTYTGFRVRGELGKRNFFLNGQKITLEASWGEKEQRLVLGYEKPAFIKLFSYYLDFAAQIGYTNLEFDGFQEEKAFARAYVEYDDSGLKAQVGMAVEQIDIATLENLAEGEELKQAVSEGEFFLVYPYVDVRYDARDSKLNPKYGYYLAGYAELGLSNEDDASVYLKTLFEARFIHSFSDLTLAVVGKVGLLDVEGELGLPESKHFFGGGSYSNRAYGYRELGVILSPIQDSINGASTMANLSFEADYPLWGDVYGAVFTDNTMLTEESYDFKGEIISSAGVGVRYMTPIGPFKLDVGFNTQDASQYGISFQIGQSF